MKWLPSVILCFMSYVGWTQEPVHRLATFTKIADSIQVKIDAVADEGFWAQIPVLSDFEQFRPDPGAKASSKTEVRIAYNNRSLYIFATLHESTEADILSELSLRDELFRSNTDIFGIYLDPYRSGNTAMGFFLSPDNVQADIFYSNDDDDPSWEAVWDSKTKVGPDGWTVEMEIPYSQLRFPKSEEQIWNFNILRRIRRHRETNYFNPVNPNINGLINQFAYSTPLRDIQPPLRLSAIPFISLVNTHDGSGAWNHEVRGGMDLKWGINESYTLDMSLIPDFSQVRTDDQILNLDPFEVFFQENRPFFKEGIDLFDRGEIFYSRRIGGRPFYQSRVLALASDEKYELVETPTTGQLLNAIKLSGRSKNGLGIGVLNAVINQSDAILRDVVTGDEMRVEAQPLSNYNMIVVDKILKNNSVVALSNTNVWRAGSAYDANVTSVDFRLRDQRQAHQITGQGTMSNQFFSEETNTGYRYALEASKVSGNWRWLAGVNTETRAYNTNDMGFLQRANRRSGELQYGYYENDPWGNNIRGQVVGRFYIEGLEDPSKFSHAFFAINSFVVTKDFLGYGVDVDVYPFGFRDFFEPRTGSFDRYMEFPSSAQLGGFISTNYAKPFALDMQARHRQYSEGDQWTSRINFEPRIRLNDKCSIFSGHLIQYLNNDRGWVRNLTIDDVSKPLIGQRDRIIISNEISTKYTFTSRINLNLRVRHYWSQVEYNDFEAINANSAIDKIDYDLYGSPDDFDVNFNTFNLDMTLSWRFLPGSDIILAWTHQLSSVDDDLQSRYFDQFNGLFDEDQRANVSLRVLYFLDYERMFGGR